MSYRAAILGPGGVGGFLAAILARAGDDVVVIARDETAREIGRRGIRLESGRFGAFEASVGAATRLDRPADAVLIAVKATHLAEALQRVPEPALGDALVVPFLNGLDHVDLLRAVYPPASVAPATIRIEAARLETGLIRHASPFAIAEIAATAANRERVERLRAELARTGVDARVREDEPAMLWDKFALLAPFALLTTHERANASAVRTVRRDDLVSMLRETAAVAAGEGVTIDPERVLAFIDSMPGSMESSMQRDQAAGTPLELDALGGALLRRGARHHVDTPVLRRIVAELEARTGQRVSA